MLKILQARLQQYVNEDIPDVQAGFKKGRGTRDQIVNIRWITEKAREFQKNIYFCFTDYAKGFDYVDHNKLCEIKSNAVKINTAQEPGIKTNWKWSRVNVDILGISLLFHVQF